MPTNSTHTPPKMPTDTDAPTEPLVTETTTVTYSCRHVRTRHRIEVKSANYPEPREFSFGGDCSECEDKAEQKGAAEAEAARRRQAGLKGRVRRMVRGRRVKVP